MPLNETLESSHSAARHEAYRCRVDITSAGNEEQTRRTKGRNPGHSSCVAVTDRREVPLKTAIGGVPTEPSRSWEVVLVLRGCVTKRSRGNRNELPKTDDESLPHGDMFYG
jgi:hypothetical protein